jgi:hypothetical protein
MQSTFDYEALAIEEYQSFIGSKQWNALVDESKSDEKIKEIIQEYGFGVAIDENGEYDHDKGCLYDDIPSCYRDMVRGDEHGSQLMYDLAELFCQYLREIAAKDW